MIDGSSPHQIMMLIAATGTDVAPMTLIGSRVQKTITIEGANTAGLKVHRGKCRRKGVTIKTTTTRATRGVKANVGVAMVVEHRGAPADTRIPGDKPFGPRMSRVELQ